MTFKDKVEILLHRQGLKKTEFAERLGITYRALANYMSGSRSPRKQIMKRIEEQLNVTSEFLLDDSRNLVLNSEERFLYSAADESTETDKAMTLLETSKELFSGSGLTTEDKQALFSCLTEIYFDSVNK